MLVLKNSCCRNSTAILTPPSKMELVFHALCFTKTQAIAPWDCKSSLGCLVLDEVKRQSAELGQITSASVS